MAKRKQGKSKRTTAAARPARKRTRARQKKTATGKAAVTQGERRAKEPESLRLRSFDPSFTVDNLERSLQFYTDVLGFVEGERWTDGGVLRGVSLKAGTCELNLSQDDWAKGRDRKKGQGMRIYCQTVQDVDAVGARIKAAGGVLAEEPTDQPWGMRSLSVVDPDGFQLTIYRQQ